MRSAYMSIFRWLPIALLGAAAAAQTPAGPAGSPGAMLNGGILTLDTPGFTLKLVRSSQTVAALQPKADPKFDFTPGDLLSQRSKNGYYHLGDLDLRIRKGTSGTWVGYSTALSRTPVTAIPASGTVLAAADLTPTLPADLPLRITRSWLLEGGALAMRFTLTNTGAQPVQIGALGIPMVFNNVLTGRTLDQAHAVCSFYD